MAGRYHINLIREEAAERRRKTELVRCVTFSLLIFAALLIVTYAGYLRRDHRITVIEARVQYLVDHMERTAKFTPEQVDGLHSRSRELEGRLVVLAQVIDGITPWPDVFMALDDCCRAGQLRLRRLTVRVAAGATVLQFESTCSVENQVTSIKAFLDAVHEHASFSDGRVLSISNESEDVLKFDGEVRLRRASAALKASRRQDT